MSKPVALLTAILVLTCCIAQPPPGPEPGGTRTITSLDGEWEFLRISEDHLDYNQTKNKSWEHITVPHFLHTWESHRAWYRRTFSIVKAPRIVLNFNSVNFRCIVYMNNQVVGEHTGGYLPFHFDITEYIKEGTNEVVVGVEDVSAVLKKDIYPDLLEGTPDNVTYPVGSGFHILGLWQSVFIETSPSVYIENVFVKPHYRDNNLELEVMITNESSNTVSCTLKNEVLDEFAFPEKSITLSPSESKIIILNKEWKNPVLWSPETPYLYTVKTTLTGNTTDSVETQFGFREFWVENGEFFLNGIPVHLRGSSKHVLSDPWTGDHFKDAEETLKRVKAVHSNVLRLHANPYPEEFLDLADEMGVLIIDESALWCLSNQYDLASDEFWDHAQTHIKDMVMRDRNHPSLVMWSVENEILLCGGEHEERTKSELIKLGDTIKRLDPTRPLMYEGDGDLSNADVINLHYPHEYPKWSLFPNEAYFLDEPVLIDSYPPEEFFWDRKKPLYIGEFLWIPPISPDPHTIFCSDDVYTNHGWYRDKAKADAWKMYVEAFRSQGVHGYCPWNVLEGGDYPTPLSEALDEVFQPLYGFIKEYSTHFFSGQEIERTLVVCNDTYQEQDICVVWSAASQSGEYHLVLKPAAYTEVHIEFAAPPTNKRESFEFSVSIGCDSHEYKITKTYDSISRISLLTQKKIALYDPVGKTREILDQNNVQYHLVDTLTAPPEYDLFIIGYHALQQSDTHTVGAAQNLFFQGNVLCFEQETLSPFGLTVTDHSSSISFIRTPVLTLDEADLQFWQPDNIVSRHDIAKPTSGNYTPVVDSGGSGGLEYTALLQYKGNTLFCQLLVTEKYDSDPGAHVLFWGLIDYAATMEWQPKTLGLCGDSDLLDSLDVHYEKTDTFEYDILFVTEPVSPELLRDFVSGGGIAWLHGLEPDYLQKIDVNTQEIPYEELPVLVIGDALMYGLSNQEFYWEGEREGWYTPLTPDIAAYSISHQDGIILTDPCIFLKIPYGKGFFLVDTLQWEYNKPKSFRIVSALLTNLGVPVRTAGVTLEAEAMIIEEVTLGERADNFYGFYTNGYLGSPVTFLDSGVYTIRVFAWADVANHEGALLQVLIDRNPVGILEVTGLGVYEIECYVERGVHEVGIAFTNDYWDPPGEDRNLYIDKIEISFGAHSARSWIMC